MGTSNNSWTASKRLIKPTSALKILQIGMLLAAIFALNSIFFNSLSYSSRINRDTLRNSNIPPIRNLLLYL